MPGLYRWLKVSSLPILDYRKSALINLEQPPIKSDCQQLRLYVLLSSAVNAMPKSEELSSVWSYALTALVTSVRRSGPGNAPYPKPYGRKVLTQQQQQHHDANHEIRACKICGLNFLAVQHTRTCTCSPVCEAEQRQRNERSKQRRW